VAMLIVSPSVGRVHAATRSPRCCGSASILS
jgi:hypothetical protein